MIASLLKRIVDLSRKTLITIAPDCIAVPGTPRLSVEQCGLRITAPPRNTPEKHTTKASNVT